MQFIQDVDSARYDAFVRRHPQKSHFMQSRAWGEFCSAEKGLTPFYVGLAADDGGLAAAALLLERRPPLFPPDLYAPRGYVVDFADAPLLEEFTKQIRAFAKRRGAMFVKIDPDVERRAIDAHGRPVEGGFDNGAIVEHLKALGYRHHGWNMGFEGSQPRFTFRIDLTRDEKAIEKGIVGNVMKNVRKSHNYATSVVHGTRADVPTLHRLIGVTSERDAFVGYDESYYQNFFDILSKHDMATLYLGRVDPAATVVMLKNELAALLEKRPSITREGPRNESLLSEARLQREIAQFEDYAARCPDGATVSAHLVVRYGDKAWAVHAGSDKLMSETFINNRVYYEKLMEAKASGARLLDQFGTVGDPDDSPLRSLHEFKKQFGGRYVEFIGEFDLVLRPFWYFLYEKILPVYRNIRIDWKLRAKTRAKDKE
ncbi:MAG: peptidoglycan bridge formation glycyltransferase FemA/FemB family protein [Oscillospiraceae bacterium]|nr:peptidoglycan bridge formation glycyltransferase FemA/FemB family protein [Oscillospiraceae bacterium]